MKNKYSIAILVIALGFVFFYNSQNNNASKDFFERVPANSKKVRQFIHVDIDYEKLPARNEIRLIGRVRADQLPSETVDYKWILTENLKLKRGSLSGKLNLKNSSEITLDVAIKNMNKKINVKLEAYVIEQNVKLGGIGNFNYDPSKEDLYEAKKAEARKEKARVQSLSKEERLREEMASKRKPTHQQ